MGTPLSVYWESHLVGTILSDDEGRMRFGYADSWRENPDVFPLSLSLPLDGKWDVGRTDHRWFANLLPEGPAREALCRSLGMAFDNDAALLGRIGADCAGAIRVVPESGDDPMDHLEGYTPISAETLTGLMASRIPFRRASEQGLIRLSLAGAQDKWPVRWNGDQLFIPVNGAPSTHIIKFPRSGFPGLAANEAFTTAVARACDLPVPESVIYGDWLLITRFDRRAAFDGRMVRIHQEDFCQALGYDSRFKYQDDGGPDTARIAALIRSHHARPAVDLQLLTRWQIFNVLVGNADGHAKNISRLMDRPRGRLAPFYDLVCTAAYEGLSPHLAMKIGNQRDPGKITRDDWNDMADSMGLKSALIFREIERLLSSLTLTLADEAQKAANGASKTAQNAIDRVVTVIRNRIRRTQTLLVRK